MESAVPATPRARSILVIEDEAKIRDIVRIAAAEPGDRWHCAATGAEGLRLTLAERPDVIVLDLGLPDMDGLDLCRQLRSITDVPIVVLSARHAEDQKSALLDAGADDYVTKPFGPTEFRARLRAHLRRALMSRTDAAQRPFTLGDLLIDSERRTVTRGATAVHLSPTEWALLMALAANIGRTLTHQQLFQLVWGNSVGHPQQYLRVYITHLRKKVEPHPYAPKYIITEPGVGYRLEAD